MATATRYQKWRLPTRRQKWGTPFQSPYGVPRFCRRMGNAMPRSPMMRPTPDERLTDEGLWVDGWIHGKWRLVREDNSGLDTNRETQMAAEKNFPTVSENSRLVAIDAEPERRGVSHIHRAAHLVWLVIIGAESQGSWISWQQVYSVVDSRPMEIRTHIRDNCKVSDIWMLHLASFCRTHPLSARQETYILLHRTTRVTST
jgi:hypothetical protein